MRRLTNEEAQTVRARRRPSGDRPTYYNAGTDEDNEISEEFEAFLILLATGVKTEAVAWINAVANSLPEREDWNDLLMETIAQQAANATARLADINETFDGYEAFRTNFRADGFEDVEEVGTLLEDLQIGMGELSGRERESTHLEVLSDLLQLRAESGNVSESRLQQLRSWITPLLTY